MKIVFLSRIIHAINEMLKKDIADNNAIGDCGAAQILLNKSKDKVSVLTHCNTGSLATAGYGTALGVIRSLHKFGKLGMYKILIFINRVK